MFSLSSPLETQEASKVVEVLQIISFAFLSSTESDFPNHPCQPHHHRYNARKHTHTLLILLNVYVCLVVTVYISHETVPMPNENSNCSWEYLTPEGEFNHKVKAAAPAIYK